MNNQRIKKAQAMMARKGFQTWQVDGFKKWARGAGKVLTNRRVAHAARQMFGINGF